MFVILDKLREGMYQFVFFKSIISRRKKNYLNSYFKKYFNKKIHFQVGHCNDSYINFFPRNKCSFGKIKET